MVICRSDGTPVDVVHQNEKGHKKTIESGSLWALHPETDRLLPYDNDAAAAIEDRGSWYLATLDLPGGEQSQAGEAQRPSAITPGVTAGAPAAAIGTTGSPGAADIGQVLTSLAALIQERRTEMPDGSYTTHLFERGTEKIRKKTGEEAVELILSRDRAEMTSEAADLIYHLLVLLEVEEIPLDDLAAELRNR